MGAEEKNRTEILSRLVADLFVKTKGGEELSSKIHRLRDEIKKVIESGDTIYGKFRGLVESFQEIIPDEKQRYHAAAKALSATSKLSRQELVKAVKSQLEELKMLEKRLMPTLPGWRDGFKAMEARSRELRDDISKLREKIGRLESEEKDILSGMAAREKEMEHVEKTVGELFTDIGAEITDIQKKIEELTAESAAPQTIPPRDSLKSDIPSEKEEGGEWKSEIRESAAQPQDRGLQKQCPMCGGSMNFHNEGRMWMCYSCAYEESGKGDVQVKSEGKSEILESPAPQQGQDTEWQKKCPMCGGRMNFHGKEQMWMCYSCAYEESGKGDVQVKSEGKSEHTKASAPTPASGPIFELPSFDSPFTSPSSNESQEPIKGSIPESIQRSSASKNKLSSKKKTCPSCHKKMNWHEDEKTWRCPFCEYERRVF